jgi:nitroimidazol reductase NimA-like FMN-containing flavoprotein (pyridoxamine 5'-phosphate oxidase superfamily)
VHATESPRDTLEGLLDRQLLAVLGTHREGAPYTSLVAFAATADLRHLLFATSRATRKWSNLVQDARASMLIDSRTNTERDFADAAAVTVQGMVEEVGEHDRAEFLGLFLSKHPHLADFTAAPSCALLRLKVERYILVTRFQHVVELLVE